MEPTTLVLGNMTAEQCARKLRELGETELAEEIAPGEGLGFFDLFIKRKKPFPWMHIAHNFGFVQEKPGANKYDIVPAGTIQPSRHLAGKRICIKLDRLFIASYPGQGEHNVLFRFEAKNCPTEGVAESISFGINLRATNGQHTGIIGYPIFDNLTVGTSGLSLGCETINVHNKDDVKLLSLLDKGLFRDGLKLLSVAQPAIAPFNDLIKATFKSLGERHSNVAVQTFYMGLDFDTNPAGARLAVGNYVVVQAPTDQWNWDEYCFDPSKGQLVRRAGGSSMTNYNYVVFSVSQRNEPTAH